jgi:hypothetical protein
MSGDTTTSDSVDTGAETAQLEETDVNTEAVNQDEDTSQTSETDESESQVDNSDDTELKDWAAKKNLPLDDPLKIAKMYRESEKALGKKGQKEGQLKTAVTEANTAAGAEDYQALKNEVEALSFYVNHPEAKQFEGSMVDILEEKPWLASDLDSVLDIAKGRSITDATKLVAERQAGKKEALAAAENAGRAALPKASATNVAAGANARITADNVDQIVGQHAGDTEWYKKNLDKINAALQG